MYALLLICAMAIGQGESSKTDAPKKVSRRIPIVSGKLETVTEAVKALNVKGSGFGFAKEDDRHLLHLEATTEDDLNTIQDALEKLGLAIPLTSAKVFQIKHWKAEIIANGLQFKGTGRARIVPDTKLNRLIVTGTKSELEQIEAAIALSDQPQDTANPAKANTNDPNAAANDKAGWQERPIPIVAGKTNAEIDAIVEKLKAGGKLRYRLEAFRDPEKGLQQTVVACSPLTKHLDAFEKELRDQGIAITSQPPPSTTESDFDAIVRIVDATTDNIGTIKSAFDLEPISVQIEPGETKNTIKLQGRRGDVNKAIKLLTERGFLVASPAFKVLRLKHALSTELVATLEKLGLRDILVTADPGSNSLLVRGNNDEIALVEALVANLDQEGKPKEKSDAASDIRTYVYHLMNAPAETAAEFITRMKIEGVSAVADTRTNSVIIQFANTEDLKVIIRVISGLDMKDMSKDQPEERPIPDPVTGTLWTDFAKAEAKSIETAGAIRELTKRFGSDHPKVQEAKDKLELLTTMAFDLRHKLQQAEAEQLRRQLSEIEARLAKREKNKAAIIKARIDSLLKMDDLRWDAMTRPKTESAPIAGGTNPLSGPDASKNISGASPPSKEKLEAWERVDREEYVAVKVERPGMGMGGGGFGGMGGGFGGPPGAIAAPTSIVPQYDYGVVIRGCAMVPQGFESSQIVSIGDRQLPSRFAGVAPMAVAVYRSGRYPTNGVTDFTHETTDGQSVWAFLPDNPDSLVKATVFRKSTSDFEFDENVGFAVEAQGAIESGFLLCADNGDFLGIVANHAGSLGRCLSAPAIGKWLERAKLDPPQLTDPQSAMVYVRLPNTLSEHNGIVVNGVIVTHPLIIENGANAITVENFRDGKKLTVEKIANSADGVFGLIWCKELADNRGFGADAAYIYGNENALLYTLMNDAERWNQAKNSSYLRTPIKRLTDTRIGFHSEENIPQGAVLTNLSGHWVGIRSYNSPNFLGLTAKPQYETYTAKEILRILDEETKKLKESPGASIAAIPPTPTATDSSPAVTKQRFWTRIKQPEAVIRVSVPRTSTLNKTFGAIINGGLFLPRFLSSNELAEVGEKALPHRQAGITPGGLYIYHRDRLPTGFTTAGQPPKEGDKVWTITEADQESLTCGKVYRASEANNDLPIKKDREFSFESDSRAHPGAMVFSDAGDFLGVVSRTNGSLAVCEHASSILEYLKRITIAAPNPAKPSSNLVYLTPNEGGKSYRGVIARGVLVTDPEVADQDLSKLNTGYLHGKPTAFTKRHSIKVFNDRLALIWCNEIKPEDGIRDFRTSFSVDDFAFSNEFMPAGMGGEIPDSWLKSGDLKKTSAFTNGWVLAARITEIRKTDFDLLWYNNSGRIADAVFDPGCHLLGFHIAKTPEERAKLKSPSATEVIKAEEVFHVIDEETRKLTASGGVIAKTNEKPAPSEKPTAPPAPAVVDATTIWERIGRKPYVRVTTESQLPVNSQVPGLSAHQRLGALMSGYAIVPSGAWREDIVAIGGKKLPSRLAGAAPMQVAAYRSERYPQIGITDYTHTVKDGQTVWVFVPGDLSSTFTKAKVFLKAGRDFPFDEMAGFGIEAEGDIAPGYLLCNDDADFLGIVASNSGSLGACLSAPSIGAWLQRTASHPPKFDDPLQAIVVVETNIGLTFCPIVKGVIVTPPAHLRGAQHNITLRSFHTAEAYTRLFSALSQDGEFGLIWCKELGDNDGFTSADAPLPQSDQVIFLNPTRVYQALRNANVRSGFLYDLRREGALASKVDETHLKLTNPEFLPVPGPHQPGSTPSQDLNIVQFPIGTVTSIAGHWLGTGLGVTSVSDSGKQTFHYNFRTADYILKIVDAETNRLRSEIDLDPTNLKPATGAAADEFWNRVNKTSLYPQIDSDREPDLLESRKGESTPKQRGVSIKGTVFFPRQAAKNELRIEAKPQSATLMGVTPYPLFAYHCEKPHAGVSDLSAAPKAGEQVWIFHPGNRESLRSGTVKPAIEPIGEFKYDPHSGFGLTIAGSAIPGSVVCNNQGQFLGLVAKAAGANGVALSAKAIGDWLARNSQPPSKPPTVPYVVLSTKTGTSNDNHPYFGVVVKGVIVTDPKVIDKEISSYDAYGYKLEPKLTLRQKRKSSDGRFGLIACNELTEKDGFTAPGADVAMGDYVFSGFDRHAAILFPLRKSDESVPIKIQLNKYGPWIYRAVHPQEVSASEFKLNTDLRGVAFGQPIFSSQGSLAGIVTSDIDWEKLPKGSPGGEPPPAPGEINILKAAELFRIIDEESKKLAPETPNSNAAAPP